MRFYETEDRYTDAKITVISRTNVDGAEKFMVKIENPLFEPIFDETFFNFITGKTKVVGEYQDGWNIDYAGKTSDGFAERHWEPFWFDSKKEAEKIAAMLKIKTKHPKLGTRMKVEHPFD